MKRPLKTEMKRPLKTKLKIQIGRKRILYFVFLLYFVLLLTIWKAEEVNTTLLFVVFCF